MAVLRQNGERLTGNGAPQSRDGPKIFKHGAGEGQQPATLMLLLSGKVVRWFPRTVSRIQDAVMFEVRKNEK